MNIVILMGTVESVNVNPSGIAKLRIKTRTGYNKEKQEEKFAIVPVTGFQLDESVIKKLKPGARVFIQGSVSEYQRRFDECVITTADVKAFQSGFSIL